MPWLGGLYVPLLREQYRPQSEERNTDLHCVLALLRRRSGSHRQHRSGQL